MHALQGPVLAVWVTAQVIAVATILWFAFDDGRWALSLLLLAPLVNTLAVATTTDRHRAKAAPSLARRFAVIVPVVSIDLFVAIRLLFVGGTLQSGFLGSIPSAEEVVRGRVVVGAGVAVITTMILTVLLLRTGIAGRRDD